jgi:Lrp/AsnC family transcriptional regulator, leucine-responsive regulatory protein
MPREPIAATLDRTDCAIVRLLQSNGRDSFAEIGKAVGLSATSAGDRVRRLEQSGVIEGYRAAVSAKKLGYALEAFILARPIGSDARFASLASELPEILECHRVTGDVSFIARAVFTDIHHLERILNHLEPSTSHVVTLMILSTSFTRPVSNPSIAAAQT